MIRPVTGIVQLRHGDTLSWVIDFNTLAGSSGKDNVMLIINSCYNCRFLSPNRSFCCCPCRGATEEELVFSEITDNNDIGICRNWKLDSTERAYYISMDYKNMIFTSDADFEQVDPFNGKDCFYFPNGNLDGCRCVTGKFIFNNGWKFKQHEIWKAEKVYKVDTTVEIVWKNTRNKKVSTYYEDTAIGDELDGKRHLVGCPLSEIVLEDPKTYVFNLDDFYI